jgi:ADP-heptose:LPS heptosyltransferase
LKDVFIFRIGHLGDTLVALPAIRRLWEYYQKDNLILITNTNKKDYVTAGDVLKYTNYFKEVFFYDAKDIKTLLKLIPKLRGSKNEKILYYLIPSSPLKRVIRDYFFFKVLCGIDRIMGIRESIGKIIVRDKNGNLLPMDKESERLLKLVYKVLKLDYRTKKLPSPPVLFPPKEAYDKVKVFLRDLPEDTILIALGHGSKMPAKRWPIERYKDLCCRLGNYNEKISIVLFGDKEDFESGEYLRKGLDGKIINVAGSTSIIESAALLSECSLYVGNDTGAMHLAAAMGVPTISIFTARENPGRWEPHGENNIILRKEVECEGCFLEECFANKMKCLDMIGVNEVFEKVIGFLQ